MFQNLQMLIGPFPSPLPITIFVLCVLSCVVPLLSYSLSFFGCLVVSLVLFCVLPSGRLAVVVVSGLSCLLSWGCLVLTSGYLVLSRGLVSWSCLVLSCLAFCLPGLTCGFVWRPF